MRFVLVSMLLMLAAPRAEACPRGTACVAAETRASEIASGEAVVERRGKTTIDLALRTEPVSFDRLALSLRTHVAPRAGAHEMPWIWQMLRRNVYSRLPRFERADLIHKDQKFSMVLSPVVVESPQDTVPGVGIEGGF